ncbi:RNA-binding protein squid-like [Pogonomyrmex barbatus]|uniref:RNA-binding protein squid-like n=1 Tax=Pogonomyrmex barbatus TaxID=144034 RepID=A0A6I9WRI2_9HYME|nr:RNA-binding protein squid-like [Pogonomyrmex barbatus]XP_011646459.1 RNA-binding protein squid-like [Pogonomyrmex barbatus]
MAATTTDFQNQSDADGVQDQPGGQQGAQQNDMQQTNQSQHDQQQQQHSSGQSQQHQQATAGIPGKDDERKLFIGGLSRNTTEKELRDHFGKFGEIESISVKVDPHTGISRGFAFMVFTNPKTIDKLLASGDHYINKRKVDPKRVSKKSQHGKIFVGGLTPEITDDDIKNYFGQFGTIVELQAPFDKVKNQRKGFCFITFDSKEVVYKLLKTPKQTINGKEVDVKKVKVNPDPRNQGFWAPGYGYGYGGGYGYIPEYNGYHSGYDDMYANYDYAGYDGYDNMGYGPKPRGNGPGPRQFQRHQPY